MHPKPSTGLMQDLTFHTYHLIGKQTAAAVCQVLSFCRSFLRDLCLSVVLPRICNDSILLGSRTFCIDLLGIGKNITAVFTDSGHGLHDTILGTEHSRSRIGVAFLGVLAAQDLDASRTEQYAACK